MNSELDKTTRELKIGDHSPKTIKSYVNGLKKYFAFRKMNLNQLDIESIKDFLLDCKDINIKSPLV